MGRPQPKQVVAGSVEGAGQRLTLVLVGSSETRRVEGAGRLWVYTPRGYGRRSQEEVPA